MIDLEKILNGDVMTPENIDVYARTRLLGNMGKLAITPEMITKIELHNGLLPSELEKRAGLSKRGNLVSQENAREPIYYKDSVLYIPQFSGNFRRTRYEDMITAWIKKCINKLDNVSINFDSLDIDGDALKTLDAYREHLNDFVGSIFTETDMSKVSDVIFGSVKSVEDVFKEDKNEKIIKDIETEYLKCQIIKINGKHVLSIDYIYGDQAGSMVNEIARRYSAMAENKKKKLPLNFYMFGRVGGLVKDKGSESRMQRGDLVMPTQIMDDYNVAEPDERLRVYDLHNLLFKKSFVTRNRIYSNGPTLNVVSVMTENRAVLKRAKENNALCVDMEIRETVDAINKAQRNYLNNLSLGFGFVGYVSDLPLLGDTLADEMTTQEPEYKCVRIIRNHILRNAS